MRDTRQPPSGSGTDAASAPEISAGWSLPFADKQALQGLATTGDMIGMVFVATWNRRCQAFDHDCGEFARRIAPTLRMLYVDVDESSAVAADFEVCSVPTVVVTQAGREMSRYVGLDLTALEQRLAATR